MSKPLEKARFDHIFLSAKGRPELFAFYRDIMGMEVVQEWGGEGQPRGQVLTSKSGFSVTIAEPHAASDHAWTDGVNGPRPTLYFEVSDVRWMFESLEKDVDVVVAMEQTHWGVTWFVIRDPNDNLLAFFQPIAT